MVHDDFGDVVLSTTGAVNAKYLSALLVGNPGLVFYDGVLNSDSKLAIMTHQLENAENRRSYADVRNRSLSSDGQQGD